MLEALGLLFELGQFLLGRIALIAKRQQRPLFVGARVLLGGLALNKASFVTAIGIAVVSCAASALIGAIGATVGGKPFAAALIDPGIGWFIGDTISAFLGLYLLAMFTQRARAAGIIAS